MKPEEKARYTRQVEENQPQATAHIGGDDEGIVTDTRHSAESFRGVLGRHYDNCGCLSYKAIPRAPPDSYTSLGRPAASAVALGLIGGCSTSLNSTSKTRGD